MSRNLPIALALLAAASLAAPARAQFTKGDLYVSDSSFNCVYRIEPGTWNVTTFADSGDGLGFPSATLFTRAGTLLCSSYNNSTIYEFDSAGNGSVLHDGSSGLVGPYGANGLAVNPSGDLFVCDRAANLILRYPAGGGAATIFADHGLGMSDPYGIAFAANGDVYIANYGNKKVIKIDTGMNVSTFDTLPDNPYSMVMRANGDIYVSAGVVPAIYRYPGGDASQRTKIASFPKSYGDSALQLSVDGTKLYFTTGFDGDLYEVDADTGAKTEVIAKGAIKGSCAITVIGAGQAYWTNYGVGLAGTNGVPTFTSQDDPFLGSTITLDLGNSLNLPTSGILAVGFQQASLPTGLGSDLLLIPAFLVPINFSYGFDSFTWTLPNDPACSGIEVDLQAVEADAGAVKGWSFSPGLQLQLHW